MLTESSKPGTRSLLWKIFITCAASAATYITTTIANQPEGWALMLSAFVGGVTLVVQFLLDVEARQAAVDGNLTAFAQHQRDLTHQLEISVKTQLEGFNQANRLLARLDLVPLGRQPILELVQHAAELDQSVSMLAHRLAASEISNLSNVLNDLGRGREVATDSDEWSWIFTLTANVQETIDATSYSARGYGEQSLRDDDMWVSELGRRYLEMQEQAIQRGVAIRRIFILETPELAEHPELRRICDQHCGIGIDVRLIDATAAAAIVGGQIPLIIFDCAISYELTPSSIPMAGPGFMKTTLVLNPSKVHGRFEMFQRLWNHAKTYERD